MGLLDYIKGTDTVTIPDPIERVRSVIRRKASRVSNRSKLEQTHTRGFDAAVSNNLTADWFAPTTNINGLLASQLTMMRARCRESVRNDDIAKGFSRIFVQNVVGPDGIRIQALARDTDGTRDEPAADAIELEWNKWAKYKTNCDMAERNNWRDTLVAIARAYIQDGEVFIRMINGQDAEPYGFKLQLIEPSLCDVSLNQKAKNGNNIVLGVELDKWNRATAYYFKLEDQTPEGWVSEKGHNYLRIESKEVIHYYTAEFPNQVRGIPPMAVALPRMRMLKGYEDAALINARAGAAKMGIVYRDGDGIDPANSYGPNEELIDEFQPGTIQLLPSGHKFESFSPDYPNNEIEVFKKAVLRSIATGLGVDYISLGNDQQSTNNASARAAIQETRELWMSFQRHMIDNIVTPIYEAWLRQALIRNKIISKRSPRDAGIRLSLEKIDKWKDVKWQAHRWKWFDPARDAAHAKILMDNRIKAPSTVASEIGYDFEQEVMQAQKDEAFLEKMGLERIPATLPSDIYSNKDECEECGRDIENCICKEY